MGNSRDIHPGHAQTDDCRKIIIYRGELDYLSSCILESPGIETGGNLFGLFTPFGIPFVHYVVGPGPGAVHEYARFRQDIEFLEHNADCLVGEHALHHIGTWHSHHSLGLAQPSGGDSVSTLTGMRECGLQSFVLLIGNCRRGKSMLNAFRYHAEGSMERLRWVVLEGESPFRHTYDGRHPNLIHRPVAIPDMMPLDECELLPATTVAKPQTPVFDHGYWLESKDNRKQLAAIVKFLKTEFGTVAIYQTSSSTVEVEVTDEDATPYRFVFGPAFPSEAPRLLAPKGKKLKYRVAPAWDLGSTSISEAFINYFKTIII